MRRGFTLIELLVVIAVIGILSSIVLASLNSARDKSKVAAAKSELTQIRSAINILSATSGLWPGGKTIDELESGGTNEIWDLSVPSAGLVATDGSFPGWGGPYMSVIPLDPWNHPYFMDTDYEINAEGNPCDGEPGCDTAVVIGSFGPNGTGQNLYDGDDVILILSR